jgi:DNA-binding transcriptional ArsR family regulator
MVEQLSKVLPLRPKKETLKASEKKWGKAVMKLGFNMIPALLLRGQRRLGLSPTQLAVLLQLTDFWWEKDRIPFPSKQALSDRLGISPRQVQRHIAELEEAGLVKRIERTSFSHKGKSSNAYDLSGLVKRLQKLAPEFADVEKETKNLRQQVKRRGGIRNRFKK